MTGVKKICPDARSSADRTATALRTPCPGHASRAPEGVVRIGARLYCVGHARILAPERAAVHIRLIADAVRAARANRKGR